MPRWWCVRADPEPLDLTVTNSHLPPASHTPTATSALLDRASPTLDATALQSVAITLDTVSDTVDSHEFVMLKTSGNEKSADNEQLFRLRKKSLSRISTVFADMFALGNVDDTNNSDELPVITVKEIRKDTLHDVLRLALQSQSKTGDMIKQMNLKRLCRNWHAACRYEMPSVQAQMEYALLRRRLTKLEVSDLVSLWIEAYARDKAVFRSDIEDALCKHPFASIPRAEMLKLPSSVTVPFAYRHIRENQPADKDEE